MAQLDKLIHEVIEFSNLVAYSENPGNPDLLNACHLFSDYLSTQLKLIRRGMIGPASAAHSRWTAAELNQLGQLAIFPSDETCQEWICNLFQHCITLQRDKLAA
ncbi:MAG: hypothetical protein QG652_1795 [Pseudomonadota bacterium]|nr:hypothetical protein [Pseudomonadota bacterium]